MNNHRNLIHCALVALAALLTVGPAEAAKKARAADNGISTREVLTKIHASNQKEIQAGQFAEKHAKNKDVIAYAMTLVNDHSAADEKVMDFAKRYNVDLGTTAAGASAMDKKDLGHLADIATGDQFDSHFVRMMLEDHKKTIAELTRVREASADAPLKDLIDELLPTLKEHQEAAEELMDKARL